MSEDGIEDKHLCYDNSDDSNCSYKSLHGILNIDGRKKIFYKIVIMPEPFDNSYNMIDNLCNESSSNASFKETHRGKKAFEIRLDDESTWEDN